jgi:hypothetical protein
MILLIIKYAQLSGHQDYWIYGLLLWKMPQFSDGTPIHLKYLMYCNALRSYAIRHTLPESQKYAEQCLALWKGRGTNHTDLTDRDINAVYFLSMCSIYERVFACFRLPLQYRISDYLMLYPDDKENNILIRAVIMSGNKPESVRPFVSPESINKPAQATGTGTGTGIEQSGHNALSHAVILEYDQVVKLLLEHAADPLQRVALQGTVYEWVQVTGGVISRIFRRHPSIRRDMSTFIDSPID